MVQIGSVRSVPFSQVATLLALFVLICCSDFDSLNAEDILGNNQLVSTA